MTNTQASMLLISTLVLAILLTWCVRWYALRQGVIDIPNARSSHAIPTPRGGGLGMVLAFGAGIVYLIFSNALPAAYDPFMYALLCSGSALALVGFVDDHGGVPVRVRLLVHISAASLLVWATGRLAPVDFGFGPVDLGVFAYPIAVLGIVWILNLTNFMDGIDGLAGGQAVLASGLAAGFIYFSTSNLPAAMPAALLATSALGFLILNFPPAKIFMGDVGSGTLGLFFGGLAVWHSAVLGFEWLYVWLLLLGVFVVDATYTLVRRAMRKQNIGQAHRSHAFQRASRHYGRHLPVTLSSYSIILFWLAPWAWAVAFCAVPGILALAVAYLPLLVIAKFFKAGELDD